jgi:drug/metabolite transporter (DMT)-like permease
MGPRDFLLLLMVCLLWASNNIISKYAVTDLDAPPLFYAGVRFAIVFLAASPWLLPAPKPLGRLIVAALLMGGGSFALVFMGLKTATPSASAIVGQISVPITTLLSLVILGERMTLRRLIGVAMTLAGAIVVMWDPHGLKVSLGLIYVAASAVCASFGAVMMKRLDNVRPLQFQAWVGLCSVPPLALLSVGLEHDQVRHAIAGGWGLVGAVLYSALVVSVIAHSVYYVLIRRYEANLIAPLTLMTPLATIGLGVAIRHDPFGPQMLVGSVLALAGVLIIVVRVNRLLPALQTIFSRRR